VRSERKQHSILGTAQLLGDASNRPALGYVGASEELRIPKGRGSLAGGGEIDPGPLERTTYAALSTSQEVGHFLGAASLLHVGAKPSDISKLPDRDRSGPPDLDAQAKKHSADGGVGTARLFGDGRERKALVHVCPAERLRVVKANVGHQAAT
jgi:hypothetical protein